VAYAQLHAGGFAAGQFAQLVTELQHFNRCGKRAVRGGDTQSTPMGTPRAAAISSVTLGPGSTPPWPGLAPWLSFNSIILTCGRAH